MAGLARAHLQQLTHQIHLVVAFHQNRVGMIQLGGGAHCNIQNMHVGQGFSEDKPVTVRPGAGPGPPSPDGGDHLVALGHGAARPVPGDHGPAARRPLQQGHRQHQHRQHGSWHPAVRIHSDAASLIWRGDKWGKLKIHF